MYNSFGLFFSGASFLLLVGGLKQWFCKNITVKEGLIAKSVTEKTTEGLIVRKPTKRPCKPRGTRGGDFWRLGILPAELPVIYFQALPDRIYLVFRTKKNNLLAVCPYGLQANF
ncbi:MAG: hypothetical protein RBR14_06650 [Candidatus Cloacimonas acidaminovorans]|nr:hypothetical protein [Candidatus Cloacimonas acidaminovorans]